MLRSVPFKWKFCGVTGALLGLLSAQSVLMLTRRPSHAVTIAVLAAGYLVGCGLTLLAVRRLTNGVSSVIVRIEAVDHAAKRKLMRGLEALAVGDLTVKLRAGAAASAHFAGDELGRSCVIRMAHGARGRVRKSLSRRPPSNWPRMRRCSTSW